MRWPYLGRSHGTRPLRSASVRTCCDTVLPRPWWRRSGSGDERSVARPRRLGGNEHLPPFVAPASGEEALLTAMSSAHETAFAFAAKNGEFPAGLCNCRKSSGPRSVQELLPNVDRMCPPRRAKRAEMKAYSYHWSSCFHLSRHQLPPDVSVGCFASWGRPDLKQPSEHFVRKRNLQCPKTSGQLLHDVWPDDRSRDL